MLVGVTGATGFIGSALVRRHMAAGDSVRCLTRRPPPRACPGVRFMEGDLGEPDERLARFADGVDVLYHCAGEISDERRMWALNVDGTRALLGAAAGCVGRWVQVSSVGVYGRRTGIVSEEDPLRPCTPYEATKAASDLLVMEACARRHIASAVVLRPSIVFGSGMPNQSIVQLIRLIERGFFFFVGRPGSSANYVHVSNVVEALMLCGRSAEADGRVYNLSDWCTIEDFVGAIADALGRRRPRLRFPEWPVRSAAKLCSRFWISPLTATRIDALVGKARYPIDRIQRELNFALGVPTPTGLAAMVGKRVHA